MSVRWERLFGEPSSFAVRMAFHHDPDEGAAASPEMAASWGAFQIWVRNVNLCAHVDEGETLQYCHWYLLPLLEWLTENWDPMLHEERHPSAVRPAATAAEVGSIASTLSLGSTGSESALATQEACFAWQQRHALRSARDGGIFPGVHIRRLRDEVEVSWTADHLAGAEDIGFLATEGATRGDLTAVANALYEMLDSASEWLHAQVPESQRCQSLVESVRALRQPNRSEERAAWLAGLGDLRDEIVTRWRRLRNRVSDLGSPQAVEAVFGRKSSDETVLNGCLAPLLFGSASPTITEDDALSLAVLLLETYERSPEDGLAHLVCDEPIDAARPPWQQGYDLADDLLDELGNDLTASSSILNAWLADWRVRVGEITLDDPELRAVSFVSAHHAPSIYVNQSHWSAPLPHARRFTLAHELCHLLHDRSVGTNLAVASGPWAPLSIEQRANAFAAWLLMPPGRLNSAIAWIDSPINTPEGLGAVAAELEVSKLALLEHLGNLGFLNEDDRHRLRLDI
ncbi:ImmA/IrrE family metallo-endopeptidase [Candidatus Poriferisodalis sp.]|uniref:ImmA/IrrE family metallo-endopeptidase n=1 Tax=Candidatus Poriferisodalis sp. TaxID=3101277 RepID=UPI003B5C329B